MRSHGGPWLRAKPFFSIPSPGIKQVLLRSLARFVLPWKRSIAKLRSESTGHLTRTKAGRRRCAEAGLRKWPAWSPKPLQAAGGLAGAAFPLAKGSAGRRVALQRAEVMGSSVFEAECCTENVRTKANCWSCTVFATAEALPAVQRPTLVGPKPSGRRRRLGIKICNVAWRVTRLFSVCFCFLRLPFSARCPKQGTEPFCSGWGGN